VKIIALSDTHAQHREVTVPDGDVLVFAGDLMTCGRRFNEVQSFAQWWNSQPHKYKVLVAGNHDRLFQSSLGLCLSQFNLNSQMHGATRYLQDSGTEIEGVNFWGSPWQPWFYNWAFNVPRGTEIKKYWDKIPANTDVLITHGPPHGILDQCIPNGSETTWSTSSLVIPPSEHLGCEELTKAVERVKPKIHIFGHIHGSYGSLNDHSDYYHYGRFFNVSICDEQYNPANPVTVIDL
jgi:Icc-related predicted phosphoesterase